MANWKDIHLDFTPKLQKKWTRKGFTYKQVQEWISSGLSANDASYAEWLRDIKKIYEKWDLDYRSNSEKLRKEYEKFLEEIKGGSKLSLGIIKKIKIFEHSHKWWEELTFDQKLLLEQLVPNEELKERYKEYGLCKECYQPNIGWDYSHTDSDNFHIKSWCQPCGSQYFRQKFNKWTSGNQKIDEFIQKSQLEVTDYSEVLEWIPYEKFTDIKYLAQGGFSKVYRAKWGKKPNGRDRIVALKVLDNSRNITTDFLREISYTKLVEHTYIIKCYGISQEFQTGNYCMVTDYMEYGNLRQLLKNYSGGFDEKLGKLWRIAEGLSQIHKKGLTHRDFHIGNILEDDNYVCQIADLGLCRPANEIDKEGKVYGVLPYVAPEVLCEKGYAQASDIYSFGIVTYEYFSGSPPYYNLVHDELLGLKICRGLRPDLVKTRVPQLFKYLVKRCWDVDPLKRPTAGEISEILRGWYEEKNIEFNQQCELVRKAEKEAEEEEFREFCKQNNYEYKENIDLEENEAWEAFESSLPKLHKINHWAIYHSRLLPTKEITQLLQKLKEIEVSQSVEFNLEELDDWLEEQKLEIHQEIPPKTN